MKKAIAACFLLSLLGLTGCGQSGPLTIPQESAPQHEEQQ
ncbi:LPS translocon maturation chaperone LptM [Vibrio sp. RC27]